ncbi:NUDIX domain-containing protein [Rhodococcus fascians]|nr:NUDIX domain-containing protein [Rhodococcus fascians]MBY3995506.1 NUDIX domain-containing protein [Rhodococcus fascians]MBY4002002.1 NUDIX domain-containing protein [Rhodococcus fascians]MBY4007165.1 NUDIX domain-containing protein [Rhodococcus fascians]MBY4016101.1 NUDIX domain-containing protein [Rhodococcus fascians]
MSDSRPIRTAGLAYVRHRRMLQARSTGKSAFYMAGGKIDPGESPEQALHREIREELDAAVIDVRLLGVFECQAWGHPMGTPLEITCFLADLADEPTPTSEIAEIRYFTRDEYAAMPDVAPGSLMVFDRMKALDLID